MTNLDDQIYRMNHILEANWEGTKLKSLKYFLFLIILEYFANNRVKYDCNHLLLPTSSQFNQQRLLLMNIFSNIVAKHTFKGKILIALNSNYVHYFLINLSEQRFLIISVSSIQNVNKPILVICLMLCFTNVRLFTIYEHKCECVDL